jgi:hypothetical protein
MKKLKTTNEGIEISEMKKLITINEEIDTLQMKKLKIRK